MTQDNNLEAAPSESHEDENEYDSESFEYGDEGVSGEEAGSPGSLTVLGAPGQGPLHCMAAVCAAPPQGPSACIA